MKQIKDIVDAINLNEDFYQKQFDENNWAEDKNILFLNPQLSGKQLYRTLLPYADLHNEKTHTALTGVNKYNPREQLTNFRFRLDSDAVDWADFIVIPFTTENLTLGDNSLYEGIRFQNPGCKIIFSVDFNFYELTDKHPYKDIFTQEAIQNIEDNIWYSDLCFISNIEFQKYLIAKLRDLSQLRMTNIPTNCGVVCMPFYVDTKIMLSNIEYDVQQPEKFNNEVVHDPATIDNLNKASNGAADTKKNKNVIKVEWIEKNWRVKRGNYIKPIGYFKKKADAIKKAKTFIKEKCDILIYKKDGELQNSYILFEDQK